jgi:hypothetical protein
MYERSPEMKESERYKNCKLGSLPNTDGTVELKAFPSMSTKFNIFKPSKVASVSPPVKNAKEMSKLTRLSGSLGKSPEKLVSSTIRVAEGECKSRNTYVREEENYWFTHCSTILTHV